MFYESPLITTKKMPIKDTQKKTKRIKESHYKKTQQQPNTKEAKKWDKRAIRQNTINKNGNS